MLPILCLLSDFPFLFSPPKKTLFASNLQSMLLFAGTTFRFSVYLISLSTVFSCFQFQPFPAADCQFEISGSDGVIRSSQVDEEDKIKNGDALDCIWTIRALPQSKVTHLAPPYFIKSDDPALLTGRYMSTLNLTRGRRPSGSPTLFLLRKLFKESSN